ncbi:MAG: phosphoribosylglycinamide formyltransferase [Corynebacterium casei]|uniref:Phosphoribosylglycinamide formyltransferase n=2 Tax=Corynebacterium casei TaxID=160386 RepID=G7HZB2_9CORY|nr:phosphoribosylglycinamide formyltransferase [Corynebacterium casei]AHI20577.1 phosphoribosylglycinamide formyltransferase [Corynebacterium casei LMG S-19264]MDN5706163.1 phosphoribosylglycinamide formyltransferase [Corynebacterium casei]MDN5728706.1 phosphoribosylglycinamide formyltransferase [Corynebacterium casei]MDN5740170.1 phosphoribosylglycinamide formyltransferase [Corynebacterium casei]MDN5785012.1 phosphoribosylglycinamide formyltransferase [Corynebacterium casei]
MTESPSQALNATDPLKVVVLVSGTGSLLQNIIDNQDGSYTVIKVVADVECKGIERAENAGIATEVVPLGADRAQWNKDLVAAVGQPDMVVSAGFMKILGADFLATFEGRTINTHPALLPSFPGAHGVRDALAYGVKVTGSTVHFVDAGVDTGRIIAQQPIMIEANDDEASLHERIKSVERNLIVRVLRAAQVNNQQLTIEI